MLLNIFCFRAAFKIDLELKPFWIFLSLRRKEKSFIVDSVIWGCAVLNYGSLTTEWGVYVVLHTNPSKRQRALSSCGDRNNRVRLYLTALPINNNQAVLPCFVPAFTSSCTWPQSCSSYGEAFCVYKSVCSKPSELPTVHRMHFLKHHVCSCDTKVLHCKMW